MTAGRPPRASRARARRPSLLRRVTSGDRIYGIVIVGIVALLVAMALGPLESYTAAADRVDGLVETRDLLRAEVDGLEDRRQRLQDPDEIELMARSEMGLVKPGEVPFVVVAPEPELDRLHPEAAEGTDGDGGPWYRRLGRWLADVVR